MDEQNKENNIIDETVKTVDETAEDAAETVEEIAEEAAEAAENAADTLKETENEEPYGGLDKEYFDAPFVDEKEAATIKASKRTTAVLISIILVLVAVIVVFVVLFLKEYKKNSKDGAEGGFFSSITSMFSKDKDKQTDTDDPDVTAVPTDAASTDPDNTIDIVDPGTKEYNVIVTLGQYKGIEVDYDYEPITDEDVEEQIDAFLEDCSEETEVTDRPAQLGDIVLIDYTGYMNGELFDGGADTDFELELGSGRFIAGFEEGLVGANAGDTVNLDIAFPDPYPNNEELSGKPVTFVVTVNAIYTLETPELTDEFISENTEYSTVAEYRASIREELEADATQEADDIAKNAIAQKVIENCTYEGDIDEEIADTVAYWKDYYDNMYLSYYGMDAATLFGMYYGWSAEEYDQFMQDQYTFTIKYSRALDKIAEEEGFEVTEEDYEKKFEEYFFDYYGFESKEEVLEAITQEEIDDIVHKSVLQEKAESVIMDSAVINK
ncbi:MAG: trigger factor [Lachnospiraceae bacterium]|nr:trigger factor [Lachnospiraceae bacterium]